MSLFSLAQGISLVLASASPRRRELLDQLGVPFRVLVSAGGEAPPLSEDRGEIYAERMAAAKMPRTSYENTCIIAADTVVSINGEILGKPRSHEEAFTMLRKLNGTRHEVCTGMCVALEEKVVFHETTEVFFGRWPEALLRRYSDTEEPLDKAGAYAIQGMGAFLVEKIIGSHSNVIGLPLEQLARRLWQMGVLIQI